LVEAESSKWVSAGVANAEEPQDTELVQDSTVNADEIDSVEYVLNNFGYHYSGLHQDVDMIKNLPQQREEL
jgi:hypothetical protein